VSGLSTVDLLVAILTGAAVAGVVGLVVRPTPRLGPRLRPYTVGARTALGQSPDVATVPDSAVLSGDALRRVLAPALLRLGRALGNLTDRGDDALAQRLRQAGLLAEVPEPARVQAYRLKQLSATAGSAAAGMAFGLAIGHGVGVVLGLTALGGVVGATRWPARLDRAIKARRERMAIELYTVNQLLALQIRAGSGATQALQRVAQRGDGAIVDELSEVLALHRGGRPLAEALEQAARVTPEANAARTYRLLASGVAYGADLAEGLRALSDDVRQHRAETLKRTATKRRAAMLIPIIAILAPVMLLFVAAPLPSLVLGNP
jgi:tight adherence protein C